MLHELIAFFTVYGYIAVFLVLIACGFGIPIPEDITLVAGGVICGLAASMDVHLMVVVSLLGVIVGDGTMFMLGKLLGPRVKNVPLVKNVFTEKRYQQMQEKVHKYGNRILFVARFLPGLRAPIFVTAGISRRVSYWKFLVMDGGAALISVPLWVYAGYYFAHDLDDLLHWVKQSETFIISILAIIFIIWLIVSVVKKNKTKSN
ncbi:DedA family protein [Aquella oligotrophica]|uniref:DedA family protein n=1 Tax=Aquella oligotrophica TaxID=2067065 RepID=A0A2I7N9Q2_9NEIS|nr:DedA family protein [Aquella oligotrophica]